jgi:hypothetical protein
MQKAVELSVRISIAGCVWPNSVSVTLSGAPFWAFLKHNFTSYSVAETTTFLMNDATLRIEPFKVSSFGGLSPQNKKPPRRLHACETERYEASL